MKKILIIALLSLASSLFAQHEYQLDSADVNLSNIKSMLPKSYNISYTQDNDGLYIENSKEQLILYSINDRLGLMEFFAMWHANSELSPARGMKLANKYNTNFIYGRLNFEVSDEESSFVLKAIVPFDGGINRDNLQANAAWFYAAMESVEKLLNEEDAIVKKMR